MSNKKQSNNNLILRKIDLVLLKNSEETKNTETYGNLYESLMPYTTLSPNDLKQDIVFDDKARMTLTHNVKTMMDRIQGEWYAITSSHTATEEVHCQLCGAKNKYVCYIKNRINDKELHVGSECVKNYKDINDANIILSKIRATQRDTKKDARKSDFDVALGDNIDFTKISEQKLDTFPILLPYTLHNNLRKTIYDCNRIRTSYISSGGELQECIAKFNQKKEEFEKLYQKAEEHYLQYKNKPLICTRQITDWLKNNNPTIIDTIRKSNGLLNETTLQFVYEPGFIKQNLPLFAQCIKNKDVNFISVNGNVIKFKVKNERFIQPIYFTMTIKGFMKNIGCHCLTQNGYRFSKLNLSPIIENTSSNRQNVLNYFAGLLDNTEYKIIVEERISQLYWERKQTIKLNNWSNHTRELNPIYKVVTIDKILQIMESILFADNKSEKEIVRIISNKIEMGGKWITKEEKDRSVQIASEAAGMQKQREFTPYL